MLLWTFPNPPTYSSQVSTKSASVTRKERLLPEEILYMYVGTDSIHFEEVKFTKVKLSENPEDEYFVCFELYIAADENETSYLNRRTNDLGLLLDESLLTDSVLRVNGRDIPVHRAILAARWPRFYEKFLTRSNDPVVDVDGIETEAFGKLLKCVYSNRIPVSLLLDANCADLAQTLEQTRFLKLIRTSQLQQSSNNISAADIYELRASDQNKSPKSVFLFKSQ